MQRKTQLISLLKMYFNRIKGGVHVLLCKLQFILIVETKDTIKKIQKLQPVILFQLTLSEL
jgi:hypothetical protein